jgi:DNA polymerase III epsilon subunit-like protein
MEFHSNTTPNGKILTFDTETTGFPIYDRDTYMYEQPFITQLCFILYDAKTKVIERIFNKYIKIPEYVIIPEKVIEITGITKELCNTQGINIVEALHAFLEACSMANILVAHNMHFDNKMIDIELIRNNLFSVDEANYLKKIKKECTMIIGKPICNIMIQSKYGKLFLKNPKLRELHEKLFGTIPENLHDAEVDTIACLRCYIQMIYGYDMNNTNNIEEIEVFSNPIGNDPTIITSLPIQNTQMHNSSSNVLPIMILSDNNDKFSEIEDDFIPKQFVQLSDFVLLKQNICSGKILTPTQLVQLYSLTEFEKIEIILLYNNVQPNK